MYVLSVSNVSKVFSGKTLFKNISFNINDKDRVALIGDNGCGKTTLLKMILKEEEISSLFNSPLKGSISISSNSKIGYLSQKVISSIDNTIYEETMMVFKNLIEEEKKLGELQKILKNNHDKKLIEEYGRKENIFLNKGGYDFRYKIKMILNKFGFNDETLDRKISTFSGGEQTKIAFVKLLLIEPDLLILDEPTNHLDISTIEWLDNYLKRYKGAILFVSHDRYFINSLASKIIEIEYHELREYNGNFDTYLELKKADFNHRVKQYKVNQKEVEKMERFIEYFREKPRFVSRVKDREKKLERLEKIEKPKEKTTKINFKFNNGLTNNREIIKFRDVSIGFDKPLIEPFDFIMHAQDKICVMGDNGAGKTTLIRTIMGEINPLSGDIEKLLKLNIGFIRQNDYSLTGDITVLDYLNYKFINIEEKELRNTLGRFLFKADDCFKTLSNLSGGEKTRLLFLIISFEKYDFLILDEPTNHLDLITKEALIEAISCYEGPMIIVSHDRYFVDVVANKIFYIKNKDAILFEGSYKEFKEQVLLKDEKEESNKIKKQNNSDKPKYSINYIKKISKEIEDIEVKLEEINKELIDPKNIEDYILLNDLTEQQKTLEDQYEKLLLVLEDINR